MVKTTHGQAPEIIRKPMINHNNAKKANKKGNQNNYKKQTEQSEGMARAYPTPFGTNSEVPSRKTIVTPSPALPTPPPRAVVKPKPKPTRPKSKPRSGPKPKSPPPAKATAEGQGSSPSGSQHSFDLFTTFISHSPGLSQEIITTHAVLLRELTSTFLTSKAFTQRMTLIHPLTPLKSLTIKVNKNKGKFSVKPQVTIFLALEKTRSEIEPLLNSIRKVFTDLYTERLICSSCLNRIPLGSHSCSCHSHGCKKLQNLPQNYSEFVPVQMANKIHRDKLKRASSKDEERATSRLQRDVVESFSNLSLNPTSSVRNTDAENEFISYINNLPMSTILRQRIKGFRTRPLSLSASNIKSTQCLREIIHEGTEARVMTADLSQFSPVYDNLIDELGNDEAYSKWNWAGSKPAEFDFGEFGNVRIKGSPDAIFEGIPVELKTVKSSLRVGATREKIQAWSLQCAAYQLTHGNGSEVRCARTRHELNIDIIFLATCF